MILLPLLRMKYFRWEEKASEMPHYRHVLIFLLIFFRHKRGDFERPCHVFPRSEAEGNRLSRSPSYLKVIMLLFGPQDGTKYDPVIILVSLFQPLCLALELLLIH